MIPLTSSLKVVALVESIAKLCELLQIKRIGAIQEALAKQLLDKAAYERLPPLQVPEDGDE